MLQHRRDTYAPPADAGREVETAEVAVQTAPLQLPGRGGRGSVSCVYTDDMSAGGVYTGPLLGAQAEDAGRRGSATGIDSAMRPPELSLDERVLTLDVGSKSSGRTQSLAPSAVSSGGKELYSVDAIVGTDATHQAFGEGFGVRPCAKADCPPYDMRGWCFFESCINVPSTTNFEAN